MLRCVYHCVYLVMITLDDISSLKAHASCDNTELEVATTHHGQYNVKVLVHTPKVRLWSNLYTTFPSP